MTYFGMIYLGTLAMEDARDGVAEPDVTAYEIAPVTGHQSLDEVERYTCLVRETS